MFLKNCVSEGSLRDINLSYREDYYTQCSTELFDFSSIATVTIRKVLFNT